MPPLTRGIQAFGGNMPFLGGRRIATVYGERYADWLTEVMTDSDRHDPDIEALRRRHEELDQFVLQAYGWDDVEVLPYDTPSNKAFDDALAGRLFALNAQRATMNAQLPGPGLRRAQKSKGPRTRKTAAGATAATKRKAAKAKE
jgi:hypothetical protein